MAVAAVVAAAAQTAAVAEQTWDIATGVHSLMTLLEVFAVIRLVVVVGQKMNLYAEQTLALQ